MTDVTQQDQPQDSIKGKDNPQSLVNITPQLIAERIAVIPDEILELRESEIERRADPHDVERKLRAAFQMEHERSIRTGKKMELVNIYSGICSFAYFKKSIITSSLKLAYIIRPFTEYQAQLEDMLQLGLDERLKILKRPLVDKDTGKFDHKLAALKETITRNLEERRRGAVTQRVQIDQKSLNMTVTKDVTESPATPQSIEALDQRLRELEAEASPQLTYKDVTQNESEEI